MKVYCVSITLLVSFEWSGKVLKRQGVKGLKGEIWRMRIRGGKRKVLRKETGERKWRKSQNRHPQKSEGATPGPATNACHPPV